MRPPQSAVSELESDPTTTSLSRIDRILSALDVEIVVRPRNLAGQKAGG